MLTSIPPGLTSPTDRLPDVATDHVEDHVDSADVLARVVVEVDELLRPEINCCLPVGGTSTPAYMGARLAGELCHQRADTTCRAVYKRIEHLMHGRAGFTILRHRILLG